MIGMPVTSRRVWGHAYGHDIQQHVIVSMTTIIAINIEIHWIGDGFPVHVLRKVIFIVHQMEDNLEIHLEKVHLKEIA
jgi:hypothetical protein